MRDLKEKLQVEAGELRKQAELIWEVIEGHERGRLAFESSLAHFEQQRLCITVMGEFNTGKSTLLNTFIGDEILATDQLECTAVPTWVRWTDDDSCDENRQAIVIYENRGSEAMTLSEISARTTLDQDFWKAIERVEITLPQPIDGEERPTGFVLVDTPGLNGNPELEARSIHQLGMSHVTIVVVPVDGIGRKSDVELIKKARSIADRVMVVINKCDKETKTGDGFEKFKEYLHRRVPDLPQEDIYTISAKRAFDTLVFEDNAYRDGEEELKNEFRRFIYDLRKNALHEDLTIALRKRPLLLLREICKAEIARIKKLEAEYDASILKDLEAAELQLKETTANLQRSLEEILRLARNTLMGELNHLQHFLTEEQLRIEREMTKFVDGLEAELIERDDLDIAQKRMFKWLNKSIKKSIFDRVSRLLSASENRLIYDLENRGRVSALDLSGVASIKLDMAPLKQQAGKASEALSRREDEIDRLKWEVTRRERAVKMRTEKVEKLGRKSAQLKNLEAQRKKAVRNRAGLGLKPTPKVEYYTAYETRKVPRGGWIFGRIVDWVWDPKTEQIEVKRQRKDYSRVRKWESEFKTADKKVSDLKKKIEPLKNMRTEMRKIKGELLKLQREADNAKENLRQAEEHLLKERERYRQAGIKTRQTQLKKGVRGELKSLFDSLPDSLEREAEQMLEGITRDFSTHFKKAADQHQKSLTDEMERRTTEARAADAERIKRECVRKTLEKALETFLNEE